MFDFFASISEFLNFKTFINFMFVQTLATVFVVWIINFILSCLRSLLAYLSANNGR